MSENKKRISLVLPAYREAENIALIYDEICRHIEPLKAKYDFEIIFVNDGSPDNTWDEIVKLCEKDQQVKGVNLSRNF